MNIDAYLKHIAYDGPRAPTSDCLRAVHLAHLRAVPFENLDIHTGQPITLDLERIYDKVVGRGRGGFCYELNGLFAWLLAALGFDVTLLSARVWTEEWGGFGPEFDHLVLKVALDGGWLCDVGFGASFLEPLPLSDGAGREEGRHTYHLIQDDVGWRLRQRVNGADWQQLYTFTLAPRRLDDFADMCAYHQVSPRSHFTRGRVCTRATPDGRVTLTGDKLVLTRAMLRQEFPVEDEAAFAAHLRQHFGIVLPGP